MTTYTVTVTRTRRESADIEVSVLSIDEAMEAALMIAEDDEQEQDWVWGGTESFDVTCVEVKL